MTQLLNSAFEQISKLPEIEQNIFARFIIDEIESEKKWEQNFANNEVINVLEIEYLKYEELNDDNSI